MIGVKALVCIVAALLVAKANLLALAETSVDGEVTPHLKLLTTVDNKTYYEDVTARRNWTASADFCRSVGMELANINSAAQFAALTEAGNKMSSSFYWTAGRDAMEIRQFSWNGTNEPLSSEYLKYVQVGNTPETCLMYQTNFEYGTSQLRSLVCWDLTFVLCEKYN